MGRRGPPPKPTALKVLEGNPGKQKLNKNEPQPPAVDTVPKPPDRLLKEAKVEWKRLAPTLVGLGLLTEADIPAFTELCQNYGYYLVTDRKILDQGDNGPTALQKTPSGWQLLRQELSPQAEQWLPVLAVPGAPEKWGRALPSANRAGLRATPDGRRCT